MAEKDKLLSKRALQINTLQVWNKSSFIFLVNVCFLSACAGDVASACLIHYVLPLKAQLKELAYSPRNYKRTMPIQYTWPTGDQEVMQDDDADMPFSQLRAGESLLEIHIKVRSFHKPMTLKDSFIKTCQL